jgi:hypothetical protein
MKLPAFQFYPGDWRKDPGVQALDFHDRGVWLEIICLMHESEERGKLMLNGAPMPEEALARLLGLDKQNLTNVLTTLLTYGVASRCEKSGALMCRRMVRDENIRKIRTEAGKKGGNPALVNQKPTTEVKQKSTPSSSSSSSDEDVTHSHSAREGLDCADEPREIPDIRQILAYADRIGLAAWRAEDEWNRLESNGWLDGKGHKIRKWGPYFTRVKTWWESDGRPMERPKLTEKGAKNGYDKKANAGGDRSHLGANANVSGY